MYLHCRWQEQKAQNRCHSKKPQVKENAQSECNNDAEVGMAGDTPFRDKCITARAVTQSSQIQEKEHCMQLNECGWWGVMIPPLAIGMWTLFIFPYLFLLFPSFPTCPSLNFIPFTLKAVCTHLLLHMFDLYVFDPWSYVPVSTLRLCIFGCIYYRLCSLYYKYLVVAIVGTQTCICLSLANPSSPLSLFLVWLSKPPHANPRTTDLSHWTHRNLNSHTPRAPHPHKDVTWGVVVNDSGINLECCRRGGKRHTQKGNV